jgi:hypothetical protein
VAECVPALQVHYVLAMSWERRWMPGPPPGAPPWLPVEGHWADVYLESPKEREAAYRSARTEAERVDSESDWIAFEATASEILSTVSPGHEPRLFQGAPLREAWTRLASTEGLPPTKHRLHTIRRSRKWTWRGTVATNKAEGCSAPVWPAPRGASGMISNDYLDGRGNLYTPRTGSIAPGETYLMAVAPAGALDGDAVQLAVGDDVMGTIHHWSGALWPVPFVSAVCSALHQARRASRA